MKPVTSIVWSLTMVFVVAYTTSFSQEVKSVDIWEMSLEELQEVKISTVSKSEELLEYAAGVATVISSHQIQNMGARNLEDVLRSVVGMDIIQKPFQPLSYVGMRGMYSTGSNNKTKIMLNGHTLESAVGDPFFHINTLPLDNIERIEIIRGPGSALYGTNAFLGLINIITKTQSDPVKLTTSGGSFNTFKQTAEISLSNSKTKFYLYADYAQTDGPSLLVKSDKATKLFGSPYSSSPGYTTEGARYYTLQPFFSRGNLSFTGFFQGLETECPIGVSLALTDGDDIKSYIGFGELKYDLPVSRKIDIQIKGYGDYYHYDGLYEIFSEKTTQLFSEAYPLSPFPVDEGVNLEVISDLFVVGSELNVDYELIEGIDILVGASYEYINQFGVSTYGNTNTTGKPLVINGITYQPNQYLGGLVDVSDSANWNKDASRNVAAVFGQMTFDLQKLFSINEQFSKSLVLTLGSRYDSYSDVGSSFNPRIGLVYSPFAKFYFKVLYGEAFRAPFFHELFQANNSVSFGNANLKPENMYTWEGQVGYSFSKTMKWTFTYFLNNARQLILRDENGEYRNIGKYHASGIEAEMRITAAKNKYAFINFSYVNVKNTTHQVIHFNDSVSYTQTDLQSGRNPAFIFNVGGNYNFTKKIIANVSVNYTSERLRSNYKGFTSSGTLNLVDQRDPVKGRALVTATLTVNSLIKKLPGLSFQLSGYNLFNVNHIDPEESDFVTHDIPRAGQNFRVRLTYTFK